MERWELLPQRIIRVPLQCCFLERRQWSRLDFWRRRNQYYERNGAASESRHSGMIFGIRPNVRGMDMAWRGDRSHRIKAQVSTARWELRPALTFLEQEVTLKPGPTLAGTCGSMEGLDRLRTFGGTAQEAESGPGLAAPNTASNAIYAPFPDAPVYGTQGVPALTNGRGAEWTQHMDRQQRNVLAVRWNSSVLYLLLR